MRPLCYRPVAHMFTIRYSYLIVCALLIQSCAIRSPESNSSLNEGGYTLSYPKESSQKVYLTEKNDTVSVYAFNEKNGLLKGQPPFLLFPEEEKTPVKEAYFRKPTYDLDIITIPVKYRFATAGFPNQLNANVNAALYAGLRTDYYRVSYIKNPLSVYQRKVAHFGYSYGVFAGLGSTYITPSITRQLTDKEYDGLVAMAGLSGNVAINRFTLGLALGFDHLLDTNRSIWIYRGKPWLGLTVGLNLN